MWSKSHADSPLSQYNFMDIVDEVYRTIFVPTTYNMFLGRGGEIMLYVMSLMEIYILESVLFRIQLHQLNKLVYNFTILCNQVDAIVVSSIYLFLYKFINKLLMYIINGSLNSIV